MIGPELAEPADNDELLATLERIALDEPVLIFTLDTSWLINRETGESNVQACIRIAKPGTTERSKPIQLGPLLVADKHSALLRTLANLLETVDR